jgi:hypothetical protein
MQPRINLPNSRRVELGLIDESEAVPQRPASGEGLAGGLRQRRSKVTAHVRQREQQRERIGPTILKLDWE